MKRKLLTSGGSALALKVAAAGLGYALFVAFARWMTITEYGEFSVAFSTALFVGITAACGLPGLLLRFLAEYGAKGKEDAARGVIRFAYGALAITCAIAAFGFLGVAYGQSMSAFFGAALLAPAFALAQMQAALFRSYDMIFLAIAPHDVIWRVAALVCAFAVMNVGGSLDASSAMVVSGGTLALVVVVQAIMGWRRMPKVAKQGAAALSTRLWVKTGLPIWGAALCIRATQYLAVMLAGLTLSLTDAALFFAALKTARLLSMPLDAGGVIGQPMLGRALHSDKLSDGQRICVILAVCVTAVSFTGYLILVFGGQLVLRQFGEAYVAAYHAMLIIGAGVLFNAMSGPTSFIMLAVGAERRNLLYLSVSNGLGLLALAALGARYGLEGAATGYAIGLVGWNIMVWRWSRVNLGIDPTILAMVFPPRPVQP